MRRSSMVARATALIVAGVVVIGACGGDDDDTTPSGAEDVVGGADDDDAGADDDDDAAGDAGDDSDAGDLPDPCELVTQEDAQELFGADFVAVHAEDDSPVELGASCIWENEGSDELGNPSHLLQVRVYDGEQFYSAEVYPDAEELEIGERAFVDATEGGLGGVTVQFVQDGRVFDINYAIINIGVEGDAVDAVTKQDAVVELARQAADRM